MEISQHIKNLLLTNERVILDNFGAFDSKHIPARIDKETKMMTPPIKIVIFNPEYKKSEGLLAKQMAEKEGISIDNANEQISEYVKTIKTKLNSGEKVDFKDLGELTKTDDGKYDFSYISEDNLLLDSFGLPKVSISEQDKIKTVPANKNLRKAPINKTQEKPKKKKTWLVLLPVFGLIGILLVAVYFFKPDLWEKGYNFSSEKIASLENSIFGSSKEKLEIITPEDEENQNEEIIDNSNDSIDNQVSEVTDDSTSAEGVADNQTEDISDANIKNVQEDNQTEDIPEVAENNSSKTVVNTNSSSAKSGKYYIIIGSVKSKKSAQKEQERYAVKGITTDILYVAKMDRYRISIGEFSSAKAAQDFFTNFENKHGTMDAWVWEKR